MKLLLLLLWLLPAAFQSRVDAAFFAPLRAQQGRSLPLLRAAPARTEHDDEVDANLLVATPTPGVSRRTVVVSASVVGAAALASVACPALAAVQSYPISASWTAVAGLNTVNDDLVAFDPSAYKAMKDDPSRTPMFEKALRRRVEQLATKQDRIAVLDLGTGPYALFAIAAAQAGADKVYAIEANAQAAKVAREAIQRSGYADTIVLLEGLSTDVELPEKVDVCVAEICGSIASEEGAFATICDAHRFVKQPEESLSWIPNRIQTYAAPASYTLHNLFTPPAFDWSKLNGEPVRFNCRDLGLNVMAEPILVEDFVFAQAKKKPFVARQELVFSLDGARMDSNEADFLDEFKRGRVHNAAALAQSTAHSVTGIAFWPRLILNDDITVNSRTYPAGAQQRSHWQTVLPIMADAPIGPVKAGDQIKVTLSSDIPLRVDKPPKYSAVGEVDIA